MKFECAVNFLNDNPDYEAQGNVGPIEDEKVDEL